VIKIKTVKFKNFMSYGDYWTEYNFEDGLTFLSSKNGSGKSVLLDVLMFVFYGEPYRNITKGSLVNIQNKKNLITEIVFNKNTDLYRVRRGLYNPGRENTFKIYKNDELIPQPPHIKNYQKILTNIIGLSKNYFELLIMKSSTKPMSIFNLSKGEKQNVMNKIFNIDIFNIIQQLNKNKINELKNEEQNIHYKIEILKSNQKLLDEHIKTILKMVKEIKDQDKNKLKKLNTELEKFKKKISTINLVKDSLLSIVNSKNALISENNKINKELNKQKLDIMSIDNKMKLFKEFCQGCEKVKMIKLELFNRQDLTISKDLIKTQNNKINDNLEQLEKLEKKIQKYNEVVYNEKIVKSRIKEIRNDIDEFNNTVNTQYEEIDKIQDKLNNNKNEISVHYSELNLVNENKVNEMTINQLIEPIKQNIIIRWLPFLNKKINEYLRHFKMNILLLLDEKFSADIYVKDVKLKYDSFSQGEKTRMDISFLLAVHDLFSRVARVDINIIILDEICSGLDSNGLNLFIELLNKKQGKEYIVVEHKLNISELSYNRICKVTKNIKTNFSSLELTKNM